MLLGVPILKHIRVSWESILQKSESKDSCVQSSKVVVLTL